MPRKPAAPEDLSAKKAFALEVIARLKKEYPDAACTLDYDHAWQLLVSVRLAAQCTDARVNIVVEDLFAKYPSVAALENGTDSGGADRGGSTGQRQCDHRGSGNRRLFPADAAGAWKRRFVSVHAGRSVHCPRSGSDGHL